MGVHPFRQSLQGACCSMSAWHFGRSREPEPERELRAEPPADPSAVFTGCPLCPARRYALDDAIERLRGLVWG